MFAVFDLDGTLALNEHRRHHVEGHGPKDWDAFFAACYNDEINRPLASILRMMRREGHRVEIWSGRSYDVLELTRGWLFMNDLSHVPYKGRPKNEYCSDVILKHGWLHDERRYWPDLIFDDRDSMVAMWRELGIPCYQVAKGDF